MSRKIVETSASICLEGAVLKRLREEKRLTQLYISKVVGVTTDTVSRWENDRYPSMRRDNALKLAEALEVPLEELLRRPAAAAVNVRIASSRHWLAGEPLQIPLSPLPSSAVVHPQRHPTRSLVIWKRCVYCSASSFWT